MSSTKKESNSELKEESFLEPGTETKILQLIARRGVPITLILYAFFSIFMPKLFEFVEKRFSEIRTENQRILDVHQKMEENQQKMFDQMNAQVLQRIGQLESAIKGMCNK